jgi:hypothetical protein
VPFSASIFVRIRIKNEVAAGLIGHEEFFFGRSAWAHRSAAKRVLVAPWNGDDPLVA